MKYNVKNSSKRRSPARAVAAPQLGFGIRRHKQDLTLSKLYCVCRLQVKE